MMQALAWLFSFPGGWFLAMLIVAVGLIGVFLVADSILTEAFGPGEIVEAPRPNRETAENHVRVERGGLSAQPSDVDRVRDLLASYDLRHYAVYQRGAVTVIARRKDGTH